MYPLCPEITAPAASASASLAAQAMADEVLLTPKPGLVDREDTGAHEDMDLPLFLKSAASIAPYLAEMADAAQRNPFEESLLHRLRPIGLRAEKAMFSATKGINTHKGQIFCLGVCTAAAARIQARGEGPGLSILREAGFICRGISRELLSCPDPGTPRTHGEEVFLTSGSRGARGEAEAGFPSVRHYSHPAYRQGRIGGLDHERAALQALLALMVGVEDSNVLHRRGPEGLALMRREAGHFLEKGGMFQSDAFIKLRRMNRLFIRESLSPGGCADLLALTLFLVKMEEVYG